jgi:hypothetical protein
MKQRIECIIVSAALGLVTISCGSTTDDPGSPVEVDEAEQNYMTGGMERIIPMRFSLIQSCAPGPTCAALVSTSNIHFSVQKLNQVFRPAGVQVYVESVDRYNVPTLANNISVIDPATGEDVELFFSSVKAELASIFPSMPSDAWANNTKKSVRIWLHAANTIYEDARRAHTWVVPMGPDNSGTFPEGGRGIRLLPGGIGNSTLAHEFGHFLGLRHTFSGDTAADPHTLVPRSPSARWDLVYKPGTSSASPHTFYSSEADALADDIGNTLKLIDTDGNCTPNSSTGSLTCVVGAGAYTETYSTGAQQLKGLAFSFADGTMGTNIMSYDTPSSSLAYSISMSQAELIRRYLRWDVPIREPERTLYLSGYNYGNPIIGGRRPRLGQATANLPAENLDFDGDGKRDFAYWVAPTSSGTTGVLTVLLSTNAFSTSAGQFVSISFGRLGDIPVPGDYNADGRTDFAVFQPGGGLTYNDPTDTLAYWRWCPTASPPTSTSCSSPPAPVQYGVRSDTPQAGMELDGAAGAELSVYRPADGTWHYRNVSGSFSGQKSIGADRVGAVPMAGLYDCDELTDLAVYEPNVARFQMLRSEQSWGTLTTHQFDSQFVPSPGGPGEDRAGVVVLAGFTTPRICVGGGFPVSKRRRAAALFYPHDSTWNVIWNPVSTSTVVQSCQFSSGSDAQQPIMSVDTNTDGRSDYVVVHPTSTFGGAGLIRIQQAVAGNCNGVESNVTCSACDSRQRIFPVGDMTGDGQPELIRFRYTGSVSWLTSESGYASIGGTRTVDPDAIVL